MNRWENVARKLFCLTLAAIGLVSEYAPKAYSQCQARLAQAAAPVIVRGASVPAGNLNAARFRHTATLLPDGRVLVVGGFGNLGEAIGEYGIGLNSAELYDSVTGIWSMTGSLSSARGGHTATLLQNGKVLVAGGSGTTRLVESNLKSAELYDPATGTWNATGSLSLPRSDHTATLLQNGNVLVVGGAFNQHSSTAELYDPDTGTWSLSYTLDLALDNHAASLLSDGQVLVTGGLDENDPNWGCCSGPLGSTELYEPVTGEWRRAESLITPRVNHTATLLASGKVLVVGGDDDYTEVFTSAELYSPATGAWSGVGDLVSGVTGHTATLLASGNVLVAGGTVNIDELYGGLERTGGASPTTSLYDAAAETWRVTDTLITGRFNHTASLLNSGKVLIAAGVGGNGPLSSAEIYDADAPALIPIIISVSVEAKRLFVQGANFDFGAVILLNGEEQPTINDGQSPRNILIGKKAGKKVRPGDTLQVRNPGGALSDAFSFPGL